MTPGPTRIVGCPHGCGAQLQHWQLASGNTHGAAIWSDGWIQTAFLPEQPLVARCRTCGRWFWLDDAPVVGQIEPFSFEGLDKYDVWLEAVDDPERWVPHVMGWESDADQRARRRLQDLPLRLSHRTPERGVRLDQHLADQFGGRIRAELVERGREPEASWRALPSAGIPDEDETLAALAELGRDEREPQLRQRAWWRRNDPFRGEGEPPLPGCAARDNLLRLLDLETDRLARAEIERALGRFEAALALFDEGPSSAAATRLRELASLGSRRVVRLR